MKPWEAEEADRAREHQLRLIAQQRSLLLQRVLGAASQHQQQSGQVSPQLEHRHVPPHPFTAAQGGGESAPESHLGRAELAVHQSRRATLLNPHNPLAPQQMFNNSAETWRSSQADTTPYSPPYHPQANKKDAHRTGNMTQRFTPHLRGGEQSPPASTGFRSLEAQGPRRSASQTPSQSPSLPSSPPIYIPAAAIIPPSTNPSTDWSRTQRSQNSNEQRPKETAEHHNEQRNEQRPRQRNEPPTEHLNEQRERARLHAQSVSDTERWNRRSLALRRDPHVNFRNYLEYLQHFPLRRGERPNPYLVGLLANRLMPAENDKSDRAVAVRWAKLNWEMYWEVGDVRYVVERVREGRRREEERERWRRERVGGSGGRRR